MSAPINDGGYAFPKTGRFSNDSQKGMTLRDWFAGQALAGMNHAEIDASKAAQWSYDVADAMLEAREDKQ